MNTVQLTSQERVARTLAREPADRVPIFDWFWRETEDEFVTRIGDARLGRGIHRFAAEPRPDRLTLWDHFEMDIMQVGWPDYRLRLVAPVVLDESAEWVLQRDGNDAVLRWWKHKMGTPEHVSFGVSTPETWAACRQFLTPSHERVRWHEFWPRYRRARARQRFVCYATVEVFEAVKDVLGHETMLRAMIRQPEWLRDVFDRYTQLQIDMLRLVEAEGMTCDGAFIYGDMAYNTGPFMSPKHYREFLFPYHKRLFDAFHSRGLPVIFHSDGDIRPVIEDLIAAGADAINPLENRAGMDLSKLAPAYGDRLGFVGNIDVAALLTNDREAIRAELVAKMGAAMPYHGYVYQSDHSIPPGVTIETYRWLLDEVREIGRYDQP